ncbi:MAG: orotidine-5'-phosphate decarboxylase [Actinomycetota bacterium]|nr:orotidine-5'-phosphate decarboxylase [Actinomycetota bacterium]
MDARGPLCVGVDPHPALLRDWGLGDDAAGLDRFAMTAVEALAEQVPMLKPQSAFFERHGSAGVAVLERLLVRAREAGCLVLLDVKRGDIGSTVQAYADAYLDPASPLATDAVTASPFLGFGSLAPMLDTAHKHGRGVFVLALTSNPEGPEVQRARGADGRTVAGSVLAQIAERNLHAEPMGSVGAVVGATIGQTSEDLAINGPLLVPGLGAQGGTAADVARIFAGVLDTVVPTTSREVLAGGPDVEALRARARQVTAQLTDLVG